MKILTIDKAAIDYLRLIASMNSIETKQESQSSDCDPILYSSFHHDPKTITMITCATEISIIMNDQLDTAHIKFDADSLIYLNACNIRNLLEIILGNNCACALKSLCIGSKRMNIFAFPIHHLLIGNPKTFVEYVDDVLVALLSKSQVEIIHLESITLDASETSNFANIDAAVMYKLDCASNWNNFICHLPSCTRLLSLKIASIDYDFDLVMKLLSINSITALSLNLYEWSFDTINCEAFMNILRKIANHPHLEHVKINYVPREVLTEEAWIIDENIIYDIFERNDVLQKIEFVPFSDKYPDAFNNIQRSNIKSARKQ